MAQSKAWRPKQREPVMWNPSPQRRVEGLRCHSAYRQAGSKEQLWPSSALSSLYPCLVGRYPLMWSTHSCGGKRYTFPNSLTQRWISWKRTLTDIPGNHLNLGLPKWSSQVDIYNEQSHWCHCSDFSSGNKEEDILPHRSQSLCLILWSLLLLNMSRLFRAEKEVSVKVRAFVQVLMWKLKLREPKFSTLLF